MNQLLEYFEQLPFEVRGKESERLRKKWKEENWNGSNVDERLRCSRSL
jgi:hypothetical protein